MNFPSMEELCSAIGKDSTSPELSALFSRLGIDADNLNDNKLGIPGRRIWSDDAVGLQLNFKDIGLVQDMPYHDMDEGPWVLINVILWGAHALHEDAYAGPTPYDLTFAMKRDEVRKIMLANHLGAPDILGMTGNVDKWSLGEQEVRINFFDEPGIRSMSVGIAVARP